MKARLKGTGKAGSVPAGLAMAGSASMVITILLSAAIAHFLNTERIRWQEAGYWIMGMLFLAAFIGGKCAFSVIKRQRILVAAMSGVLYWGLLLCTTALFFGGEYSAIWETAGIICAGSGTSALLPAPGMAKRGKGVRRINC